MHLLPRHPWLLLVIAAAAAALLAACSSAPKPHAAPATTPVPKPIAPPATGPEAAPAPAAANPPAPIVRSISSATNPKAYRRDAASHLYERNAERIHKGILQPHLYAIGVLDIDRQGNISAISWRRAPKHAPEVMAEIERTVRAAAPYPVPVRMGKVTYTDVWLWDKSGKFQLDTLTEGQL